MDFFTNILNMPRQSVGDQDGKIIGSRGPVCNLEASALSSPQEHDVTRICPHATYHMRQSKSAVLQLAAGACRCRTVGSLVAPALLLPQPPILIASNSLNRRRHPQSGAIPSIKDDTLNRGRYPQSRTTLLN
jgi:hypothetical protein